MMLLTRRRRSQPSIRRRRRAKASAVRDSAKLGDSTWTGCSGRQNSASVGSLSQTRGSGRDLRIGRKFDGRQPSWSVTSRRSSIGTAPHDQRPRTQDHLANLVVNWSNCYDSLADARDHIENIAYKRSLVILKDTAPDLDGSMYQQPWGRRLKRPQGRRSGDEPGRGWSVLEENPSRLAIFAFSWSANRVGSG